MSEKLTMTVDIRAQLNQFNAAMDSAKEVLNKTFSGKGIKTYTDELNKIGRIFDKITRTTTGPIDSKATFAQMQKEVMDANQRLETLRDTISNIRNLTLTQKLTFLPDNFEQDFNKGKVAVSSFVSSIKEINKTKLNTEEYKTLNEEIKKLKDLSEGLQKSERNKEINENLKSETKVAEKEKEELTTLQQQLKAYNAKVEAQKQLNKLLSESGIKANSKNKTNVLEAISGITIPTEGTFKEDPSWTEKIRETKRKQWEDKRNNNLKNNDEIKKIASNYKLEEERVLKLIAANNKLQDSQVLLDDALKNGGSESALKKETRTVEELDTQIKELNNTIEQNNSAIQKNEKENNNVQAALVKEGLKADDLEKQLEDLIKKREELNNTYDASKMQNVENATKSFLETIQKLGIDTSSLTDIETKSAEELRAWYTRAFDAQVATKELDDRIPELTQDIEALRDRAAETSVEIDKNSEAFDKLSERSENIDRLTARVKQFTGFVGVINLARKAMRDALSTVQELDKAMTSMAVVTKSTVSDYWEQLPKYTERANKLGATIRDMYEADTLYYQQGLKTNQVMQVANETMKMARIAGLGAAEATDRMTNALRGFNMAINEESAQRINDVYSKLAAITASNVDEISTAMTKTASIAHSAGMEFETTAAFLSQIIETTRESAETAGTALKTVIARFQELKKAPSEIGEVDGEIVDANKIEGALRTVGVALRDSEGQFRKLDDVFMELAGKWGSMDKNTQRYIATIAAGSRQQSRFIALMQDYSHTVELVDAAYTSAGTSQQQYEKTLESMETILKRLQNSWNTFTMGLFNSNLLKGFMKGGTELLNLLNKILDALDFTNLGIGKIAITAVGINKLGVAFKVFTNQLKQDNGTIANSFRAIGASIKDSITNGWQKLKGVSYSLEGVKNAQTQLIAKTKEYKIAQDAATAADVERAAAQKALAAQETKLWTSKPSQHGAFTREKNKLLRNFNEKNAIAENRNSAVAAAKNAETIATEKLNAANLALVQSTRLNTESQASLLAILNTNKVTLESSADFTNLCTIANNNNALSQLQEAASTQEVVDKETILQILRKNGLPIQYASTQANMLHAVSQSKLIKVLTLGLGPIVLDAAAKKADAVAATSAANANFILATAFAEVAVIAAGIVAAIYLVIRTVKDLLKLKLSERIKETQERLNECNESISDCKDALKELEDQQDKYNSLHEELQKNIQGTDEWKKKLLEVNEQVYDLIQKYPVLASYVQRASNGTLSIKEEGWNAALSQTRDRLNRARVAQYTFQKNLFDLQEQQAREALNKKGIREIGFNMLSKDNVLNISPELQGELGEYKSTVEKNTEALNILNDNIVQREDIDEQNVVNKILDSALDNMDKAEHANTGIWAQIQRHFRGVNPFDNEVEQLVASGRLGKDYRDNDTFKRWAKLFGLSEADFNGRDPRDLAKLYSAATGKEMDEDMISRARWHNEAAEMINEISDIVKTTETANMADEVTKNLTQLQKTALADAFSVGNLKQSDLSSLAKIMLNGIKENASEEDKLLAKAIEDALKELGFANYREFLEAQTEAIKNGMQQPVKDAIDNLKNNDFTIDQMKRIAQVYSTQYTASGKMADYTSILNRTGGREVLNEFFNFDLTSIEGLEEARDALIKKWPNFTKEINQLVDETRDFGNVLHNLDFDKLKEKIESLAKYLKSLDLQTQGTRFSEEAYNDFINNGVAKKEDFIKTADGNYVYLNSMEELTRAIKENTVAIAESTDNQLRNKFQLAENYRSSGLSSASPYSTYTLEDFMRENSSLLGSLGVNGVDSYGAFLRADDKTKAEVSRKIRELIDFTNEELDAQLKENADRRNMTEAEVGSAASTFANDLNQYKKTGDIKVFDSTKVKMSSEEYQRFEDILERIRNGSKEAEKEYTKFMERLSNRQTIRTAEDNMKKYMGTVKSFVDEYEDLGDKTLKYNKTLELANTYGIRDITEDNYEYYAALFDQFSQGNMEAYNYLLDLILGAHGYALEDANQLFTQASNQWSTRAKELAQILQNLGLAYEQSMGNGTTRLMKWTDLGFAVPEASGGGGKDEWEDPYNWLWNINKRINKEIFERERLERRYQKAVEDATKSEEELYEVSKKELENLERQAILERDKGQKAMQEAQMMMKQRPEFGNYVSWNAENGQIQVDYNKIDKENWGSARGEAFEAFVSRLEELNDEVQDSQTTLEEIEDLTEDIKNRGRDQFIELQERIKNALVEINQRQIDTAQKINDSIKTAQDELLSKIQEEISETRQIRSNQEKEQELEDKRQRLSYLRRDTTGANAVQIRQLEEELRKGEQSYTDSLTDQTLQNIQKANQKAEEQRAEEIEIMNNQLTRWQETGAIWDTVNTSIQEGFNNPDSFLNSNVASLIASAENRRALSEIQQADWDKDLENQAKLAELFNNGQLYQQGEQTLESVRSCQNSLATTKSIVGVIGQVDHDLYDYLTNVYPKDYADKIDGVAGGVSTANVKLQQILEKLGLTNNSFSSIGNAVTQVFKEISNFFGKETPLPTRIKKLENALYGREQSEFTVNATGGLNTKTGFAWLDGTPTKPEYVLNADQTKAFFNLVNTLTSDSSKGGVSGDNYFDIDINVDELSNDYDVDQLAARIKEQIWEDSQYRNVNLVNLLR